MNPSLESAGPTLVGLARHIIAEALGLPTKAVGIPPWMHSPGASFVTLTIDDQLRGCIGSLTAYRPLVDDIRFNAFAAAFEDPRFYPLTTEEYDKVAVEVSLLSVPETMPSSSRDQVLSSLRPGIDGVILTSRRGRTTVLPQVWEDYPTPAEFLDYLLTTAGLKPDYWGNDISIERYHVSIYDEGH